MKTRIPQRKRGLILTGPKRGDPLMFGGPVAVASVGIQLWKTGPTVDQATTSACTGFGTMNFLFAEPNPYPVPADTFALGVEIYRRAQQLDEWPGEEPEYYGSSVEGAFAVLQERGLLKPGLYWATELGQIVKHLVEVGPVVMGSDWTGGMMEPSLDGYVEARGLSQGGHCYLCYGVNVPRQTLYFLNSWGPDYGIEGTFRMTFATMEKLLARGGYGISAFEEAK